MQTDLVQIYTDGAASGNPGPGGYGVVLLYGPHRKELSEGFQLTTNNRMELMAIIKGLEALTRKNLKVLIHTDSKYVSDAVNNGWVFQWEAARFKKKKNMDLWKRFLELYRIYFPEIIWVKGHSDIPENERCDRLAVEASQKKKLQVDYGYVENID
ncbi:MAG: ribonuclease HI [Bacteroidales bacterium]|nr:ribonuclease HI [Bacteroidales bacterium]